MKLYHTNCPQCKLVEMKLEELKLDYTECTNVDEMIKLGFSSVPVLEYKGEFIHGAKNILDKLNEFKEGMDK